MNQRLKRILNLYRDVIMFNHIFAWNESAKCMCNFNQNMIEHIINLIMLTNFLPCRYNGASDRNIVRTKIYLRYNYLWNLQDL